MFPHLRLYDADPDGDPSEVFNKIDKARQTFSQLPESVACRAEVQCRQLEAAVHDRYTPPTFWPRDARTRFA